MDWKVPLKREDWRDSWVFDVAGDADWAVPCIALCSRVLTQPGEEFPTTVTIMLAWPAVFGLPSSMACASEAAVAVSKRAIAVVNPWSSSNSFRTKSTSLRPFAKRSMVRRASVLVLRGSLRSRMVVTALPAGIRSSNEGAWPGVEKAYWYGVVIACCAGEYTGLMTLELIVCRKQGASAALPESSSTPELQMTKRFSFVQTCSRNPRIGL